MPARMEVTVRKGDISSIKPLISKFSHSTYEKLPLQYKTWMSLSDLIALGTNHAVTHVAKLYKKKNANDAKFITYLYVSLENLYKDLITEAYADKRMAAVFSADTYTATVDGIEFKLYDIIRSKVGPSDFEALIALRLDAAQAFTKAYSAASPHLRKHLIHWCIQPRVTKYKTTGSKFIAALQEFQDKKLYEILTEECITIIQNDVICRNRVVLNTVGSMQLRKPGFRTVIRTGQLPIEDSLLSDAVLAYA